MVYKYKVLLLSLCILVTVPLCIFSQDAIIESTENIESTISLPENAVLLDNGTVLLEDGTIVDAQTLLPIEERDYEIVETDEGVVFIQTLSWVASNDAFRYEVFLEKLGENGEWVQENVYSTETNAVEVSLFSGTYRYSILVYNFLDLPDTRSDWFEFNVFKAIQPTVAQFSPDLLYLDEVQTGVFSFKGSNALDETLFTLEIPGNSRRTIYGDIIEQSGENFRIQFDVGRIDTGNYVFKAENPGGLNDVIEPIVVKFLKPYDLNVSFGYNFFYSFPNDITPFFNKDNHPLGFNLKVTYIPLKRNFGQIGAEFSTQWFLLNNNFDTYTISTHVLPVSLNFVYQYPLIKKRLILDTHVGAGVTMFGDLKFTFDNGIQSPSENVLGLAANAGLSFQLYVLNRLYFELGADYIITFFDNAPLQLVTPSLSVGWQF